MQRTKPPFRADHVGSLIRPDALIEAREQAEQKAIPEAELKRIQQAAIRDVVRLQEELGLKLVTDGEYNRHSWHRDFLLKFENVQDDAVEAHGAFSFRRRRPPAQPADHAGDRQARASERRRIFVDDFKFLKSIARATPKITLPSPTVMHFRGGREAIDADAYPDIAEFYDDLAASIARRSATSPRPVAAICRSTRSISPISAIRSCASRSPISARIRRRCRRPMRRLLNDTIKGRPQDMTVCMHLCRGNFAGAWVAEGGYEPIAELLFNEIDVDGYFLEYDSPRAGGFEPLRFLPKGKIAVLGLVTTKSGKLEIQGRAQAPDRRGGEACAAGAARAQPAMRFLQRHRRQHHGCRGRNRQAPPGGRDRARGVGTRVAARCGLC